jgi:hypothetical protein
VPLLKHSNLSLANALWEWKHVGLSTWLLGAGAVAVLGALWARRASPAEGDGTIQAPLVVAAGVLLFLLSSPFVWWHYYTLLYPAFILVCRPGGVRALNPGGNVTQLLAFAALALFTPLPGVFPTAKDPLLQVVLYNAGTLILFGLVLRELYRLPVDGLAKADDDRTGGRQNAPV